MHAAGEVIVKDCSKFERYITEEICSCFSVYISAYNIPITVVCQLNVPSCKFLY